MQGNRTGKAVDLIRCKSDRVQGNTRLLPLPCGQLFLHIAAPAKPTACLALVQRMPNVRERLPSLE